MGHELGRSLRLDAVTGWLLVAGLRLLTGLVRQPHKARQPRTRAQSASAWASDWIIAGTALRGLTSSGTSFVPKVLTAARKRAS